MEPSTDHSGPIMAVERQLQVIDNRYIDRTKLRLYLAETFGENNFAIRVGRGTFFSSRALTNESSTSTVTVKPMGPERTQETR